MSFKMRGCLTENFIISIKLAMDIFWSFLSRFERPFRGGIVVFAVFLCQSAPP